MFNIILQVISILSSASFAQVLCWTNEEGYQTNDHPDVGLSTIQMIKRQGYPVETHENIKTEDGYLLELHRIPHGKRNANQIGKPVIFLMHGIMSSSADWVNMGSGKSLSYILVDAGYDVWMGNARGTKWARKHIKYDPESSQDAPQFWNFSWHEIGTKDLPAMIDYVLQETNRQDLIYVGHSQGTTTFFVMLSERPDYNDKIRLMIALAPIAYMSHMTNPFLQFISTGYRGISKLMTKLGKYEFVSPDNLYSKIGMKACTQTSIMQELCASAFFMVGGWNSAQLNRTMIPVIMSNTPAGCSTKQLLHYAQEIKSGKFRQYDYDDPVANDIFYKSKSPPEYKIQNIRIPIGLFYSSNDWLAAVIDVDELSTKLPKLMLKYLVSNPKFNHLDFLFAIDVRKLCYDRVLALIKQFV